MLAVLRWVSRWLLWMVMRARSWPIRWAVWMRLVFRLTARPGRSACLRRSTYEAPSDGDGDNVYELVVSVSDGRGDKGVADASVDDSVAVSVEVIDVDEPLVLAGGDCDFVVVDSDSGGWECGFEASDPEGAEVVWSLSGDDAALFGIDGGVLGLVGAVDGHAPVDADGDGVYEVTVAAAAGGHTASADVSLTVVAPNRAPVFGGTPERTNNAPPGFLVSLTLWRSDFTDPDGDPLTFEISVSRDDVVAPDGLTHVERLGRLFFVAKTACALLDLNPSPGEVYETAVTTTATDPHGATAHATRTFRTNPTWNTSTASLEDVCPQVAGAQVDGATLVISFDGALAMSIEPPTPAELAVTVDGAAVAVAGVRRPVRSDTTITLELASPVKQGQVVTVSYTPGDYPVAFAFDNQPVTNNTQTPPNRAPVFSGTTAQPIGAPPGALVSVPLDQADFSDPDGDPLTFAMSASRDDVYVRGGLSFTESSGQVSFQAKTACALAELSPSPGEVYETVVTMTATDPHGATAHATATFRTNPAAHGCPSPASAAVDGATLVISLDGAVAPSLERPTAAEFAVTADGAAVGVAGIGEVAEDDTAITLTLASPVKAGQTVTVSYTPGDHPATAAFADQAVTNNTPPPAPVCVTPPEGVTAPTCAAVSGNDLIVAFSADLAALDAATAGALRFSIFVDGAFHNGALINSQSPSRIAVDGDTLTLTLGTAVRAGDEVTIHYSAPSAGNGLKDADGTPIPEFTLTVTTTAQSS